MSQPAVPSPTCEVTWIENGVIVTDGNPTVVVGYFHPQDIDNMVPMTAMCDYHYELLNPREFSQGMWTFTVIADLTPTLQKPDPNTQAPAKLEDKLPQWVTGTP